MVRLFALQNQDGSHCRWITQGEAEQMEDLGEVTRNGKRKDPNRKYRKVALPKASEAENDRTSITRRDLQLMLGAQRICNPHDDTDRDREQHDLERLIGFGLIPEGTLLPANGYL